VHPSSIVPVKTPKEFMLQDIEGSVQSETEAIALYDRTFDYIMNIALTSRDDFGIYPLY
jgi:hypothetical protein